MLADPEGVDNTLGTEDDDARLTSGSSAIDAGCNAEVPEDDFDLDRDGDTSEPLPLDLGWGARFLDDSGTTDCPYGGSCGTAPIVDMGSYEYLNTNGLLGAPEPPAAGSPAPEASGTAYIAFAYDALGRRIEKIVDSGGAQVEVTRYYYQDQNVILETDADEAPRRSFVHGSQYIDERVLMRLPNGQEYYYLPRELYSVAALTDEDGAIVEAATYDTYGKVAVYDASAQAVAESPVGNPYYFTGRRLDLLPTASSPQPAAKQLYHYRAREYDPGNGRFMQRDPLAMIRALLGTNEPDGINLYEYVRGIPSRGVDPQGLECECNSTTVTCTPWTGPPIPSPTSPGSFLPSFYVRYAPCWGFAGSVCRAKTKYCRRCWRTCTCSGREIDYARCRMYYGPRVDQGPCTKTWSERVGRCVVLQDDTKPGVLPTGGCSMPGAYGPGLCIPISPPLSTPYPTPPPC